MAYISRYTGAEVDAILAWASQNKGIQIDTLLAAPNYEGEWTAMSREAAIHYDLILVHGYVNGSHIPNQGMLIFDPKLIVHKQSTGGAADTHGVFSTTVFRGTPGEEGAPIAIEVYLQSNGNWIEWCPCYDIGYPGGSSVKEFRAQHIIGIRSVDPYSAS